MMTFQHYSSIENIWCKLMTVGCSHVATPLLHMYTHTHTSVALGGWVCMLPIMVSWLAVHDS